MLNPRELVRRVPWRGVATILTLLFIVGLLARAHKPLRPGPILPRPNYDRPLRPLGAGGTTAKFKVNGTASSPPGFDAINSQVITLQLETAVAPDVFKTQFFINSVDPNSPQSSMNAPTITLSPSTGIPTTPTDTVTFTMPATGTHTYAVRCVINNGVETATGRVRTEWTYERIVGIRSPTAAIRKMIPGESTQYSARGWTDEQNRMVDTFSGGGPPSGAASGDLGGSYPGPSVVGLTGTANVVAMHGTTIQSDMSVISPTIKQADQTTASTNGQTMTIQGQNATGVTSTGGNVVVKAGTGTSASGTVTLDALGGATLSVSSTAFAVTVGLANLRFTETSSGPAFLHQGRTTDAATGNMQIQSQAPYFAATGTNRNSGNLQFLVPAPVAGGTAGKHQFFVSGTERVNIGTDGTNPAFMTIGTSGAATVGAIRLVNNAFISARNAGSTADLNLLKANATDQAELGVASLVFGSALSGPTITQPDPTNANGQIMTVRAQNANGTNMSGGGLILRTGAPTGTGVSGTLTLATGANGRIGIIDGPSSVGQMTATLRDFKIDQSVVSAAWGQTVATTGSGNAWLLYAQDAQQVGNTRGGDLILQSGLGFGTGIGGTINGRVTIRVGSTDIVNFHDTANGDTMVFQTGASQPTITQATNTSTHGQNMIVKAQDGFQTSGNNDGGSLFLKGGAKLGTGIAGSVFLQSGGNNVIEVIPTEVKISQSFLSFTSSVTAPLISQATNAGANGQIMMINAQGGGTTDKSGGALIMKSGAKTGIGLPGDVQLVSGSSDHYLQLTELAASRRVTALAGAAAITTTQMPASTGDRVIYIANAATVPSANPVGGGILYVEGGALKYRGTSGTVTPIALP